MSLEKAPAVPYEEETGHIYGLDTDRKLHVIDSKYTLSNGMAWTQDMSRMFFIDSVMNKVFVYDYDPDAFKVSECISLSFEWWYDINPNTMYDNAENVLSLNSI